MAVDHYENFPVASFLLPKRLVPAVEAIYAFARSADDIADEGDATPEERLAALVEYGRKLDMIGRGEKPGDTMFDRLADTIAQHKLPMLPFYDLLSAFRQDVQVKRYSSFEMLLDYCHRSANPVGLLMLCLYQAAGRRNIADSDAICSALQLINFWQDVAIDLKKDRIYIPQNDLARFGITEADLAAGVADSRWVGLMTFQVARARGLMNTGAALAIRVPGREGLELRMVVQGGLRILERIEKANYDVFRKRPRLGWRDWIVVAWRAFRMRKAIG